MGLRYKIYIFQTFTLHFFLVLDFKLRGGGLVTHPPPSSRPKVCIYVFIDIQRIVNNQEGSRVWFSQSRKRAATRPRFLPKFELTTGSTRSWYCSRIRYSLGHGGRIIQLRQISSAAVTAWIAYTIAVPASSSASCEFEPRYHTVFFCPVRLGSSTSVIA